MGNLQEAVTRRSHRAIVKYLAIFSVAIQPSISSSARGGEMAPAGLRGKSAIIEWQETRVQRTETGHQDFHEVQGEMRITLYFSTQGHVFGRVMPTVAGRSGNVDSVVGEQASTRNWVVKFERADLSLFQPFFNSAAVRRVDVDFNPDFASCTATIAYGKRPREEGWRAWSPIVHDWVDMKSVSPGAASCSIQVGNEFAN